MLKKYSRIFLFCTVVVCAFSCVNSRQSTYFNGIANANINPNTQDQVAPLIQKNDILSVVVSSLNAEASAIFNVTSTNNNSSVTSSGTSGQTGSGFLVNADGEIQLPILGAIKVAGFTTKEVQTAITATLLERKLLIDPIVTIHHLNYEVTVIGEVGKPTVINVPSEKISLLKALGLAGDITIYGKKNNVLLIREINGKRKVQRIDLNDGEFLESPFYYLQPNDVVYVEANKNKIANASTFRETLPIVLSGLSVLLIALDRIIK